MRVHHQASLIRYWLSVTTVKVTHRIVIHFCWEKLFSFATAFVEKAIGKRIQFGVFIMDITL